MRVVYIIEKDGYDSLGVAKNYSSVIDFLINENWLDENFELYDFDDGNVKTIKEDLGEEWKETILSWDTETFNRYFDSCFYLTIKEVYGT